MISTSAASNAALRVLQSTSQQMLTAQTRISTGLKVSQASDDPTVWAAATQLRGSIKSNDAYKTGLTEALTRAKLTNNALGQLDKSLRTLQAKVDEWSSSATTADRKTVIQNEIANIQKDMKDALKTASYNGVNWLEKSADFTIATGADTTLSVNVDDQIAGSGGIFKAVTLKDASGGSAVAEKGLLDFGVGSLTNDLTLTKSEIADAITDIGEAQTNMASAQSAIEGRTEFLGDLNDILSSQLSSLVDADLNEESSKLAALQVRQQLATSALSLINQSQLNILRLFQ